jgi:hypothetical protein
MHANELLASNGALTDAIHATRLALAKHGHVGGYLRTRYRRSLVGQPTWPCVLREALNLILQSCTDSLLECFKEFTSVLGYITELFPDSEVRTGKRNVELSRQ